MFVSTMHLIAIALMSLGTLAAQPSATCPSPDDRSVVVFHDVPPKFSRGLAVIQVDFGPRTTVRPGETLIAKVKSVVRGRYDRTELPVTVIWKACSAPFADGSQGLVIGRFQRTPDGLPIFYAVEETIGERRARKGKFNDLPH